VEQETTKPDTMCLLAEAAQFSRYCFYQAATAAATVLKVQRSTAKYEMNEQFFNKSRS